MDNKLIEAAVMGAATSVIVMGLNVLEEIRCNRFIPRAPRVNREFEREVYIKSILYQSEIHCIDQIRMRPTAFFHLCEILDEKNLL